MICRNCGADNFEGARFCKECGSSWPGGIPEGVELPVNPHPVVEEEPTEDVKNTFVQLMNNKWTKPILIAVASVVLLVAVFFLVIWPIRPVKEPVVFELGELISTDINDYVNGSGIAKKASQLDISQVRTKVGEYTAYVKHGFHTYQIPVVVQDTVAPVLVGEDQICLAVEREYELEDLFTQVKDSSGDVELYYMRGTIKNTSYLSKTLKTETITILAKDPSGNETSKDITITVDYAPVITGVKDCYIAIGENYDYKANVTAYDEKSGDVTEQLVWSDETIDFGQSGQYEIYVEVSNSNGLTTKEKFDVVVDTADTIQEMINHQEINRHDQVIVGAYNLYDAGYFEEENVQKVLVRYEPAVVAITKELPNNKARGSGFVIQVTDDEVFIMTNHHVVSYPVAGRPYYVEFYDESRVEAKVVAQSKGTFGGDDMAIISVPREKLTKEVDENLITVHINEAYWEEIRFNSKIPLCIRVKSDSFNLLPADNVTGYLLAPLSNDRALDGNGPATEISMPVYGGTSGSAIFDAHGNLMAMVTCGTWNYNYKRYWGVPLSNILDFYEEHMGVRLNYQ